MERTDTEYVESVSVVNPFAVTRTLSRYDLVLGVIPIALLSAAAVGSVAPVSAELLIGVAGVLCLPVLFDALYRNPPTQPRRGSGEREATGRDDADAITGGDVDGSLGTDVDGSLGTDVDGSLGTDVDGSLGTDVEAAFGGDVEGGAR